MDCFEYSQKAAGRGIKVIIGGAGGAAHLPGEQGCVELLRDMGYTVEPVSLGKRNAKKRQKLEEMILKRKVSRYTTPDGYLSFEIPGTAYPVGGGTHGPHVTGDEDSLNPLGLAQAMFPAKAITITPRSYSCRTRSFLCDCQLPGIRSNGDWPITSFLRYV